MTSDTTKREYALLELLHSERTYASDLVLLRDYQIPLASGRLSTMSSIWPAVETTICQYLGLGPAASDMGPVTPPGSSAVASRPLTTSSNTSYASALSLASIFTLRPMKTKDVNVVFSNIEKLAAFSDEFLYQLESALGELIEGNEGEDYVGRLFLEFIPKMEPLYKTYVMNQPHAIEHYHRLSKTFQFDVYFPRSQILAHKSSNAWDLPSLLIKPVQRLLNYPQLLAAIVAETPDSHGDKTNLVAAHARMEELARGLNARWRRQKVVQEVLASAGVVDSPWAKKKGGLKVSLAASVSLGRIMSLRSATVKAKEGLEVNAEAEAVKAMGERLKSYEPFMMQFMRETMNWADAMRTLVGALDEWAQSFGRVIWMDPSEECSDAFEVFLVLIGDQLLAACDELEAEIEKDLMRTVDSLKDTMMAPVRLLEAMQTLEPLHYSPPNVNVEASESYVALRAQLIAELPTYLTLLDKGMATCILKFAHIQWRFYSKIHDQWGDLWDGLNVDGEVNEGAAETFRAWWNRFNEVEDQLASLNILRRLEKKPNSQKARMKPDSESHINGGAMTSSFPVPMLPPLKKSPSFSTYLDVDDEFAPNWSNPGLNSVSATVREDGHEWQSRKPSFLRRPTDTFTPSLSPNLYTFKKIEPWDIRDVVEPREGVVSMKEVAKSRQQVHSGVQPRIVPMPTTEEEEEEEEVEAANDSDDSNRNNQISWGANKVALQKPIIKPKAPLAGGSRRAVPLAMAYGRESSANAKFGTRLVHVHNPRPASRRTVTPTTAYAHEAAANGKFGTRLVHDPPHQAPRPASRRTVATPISRNVTPHSNGDYSVKATAISRREWHPTWDSAITNPLPNKRTRKVSQTSVATRVMTTPKTNKTPASPAPSDPDSEDSGVGLYRMIMNQGL